MCNICTMIHILYIHMCVELMKFQHRFSSEQLSCEPRFLCDFLSSWWVEYDAVKKNPWKKILNFKVKVNFVLQNWLYRFGGVESHYGGFYICLLYIDPVQMNFSVKTYQDIFMSLCYGSKHPLRLLRFYYCNIGTNTSRPLLNLRHISVLFRLWRMESLLPSLLVVFIETKEWSHPMYTYWNRYVLYSLLGYCTEYKMSH